MSAERPTGLTDAMVLARKPSGVWTPKVVAKLWRGRAELDPADARALAAVLIDMAAVEEDYGAKDSEDLASPAAAE